MILLTFEMVRQRRWVSPLTSWYPIWRRKKEHPLNVVDSLVRIDDVMPIQAAVIPTRVKEQRFYLLDKLG